ncbi:hypothetical protein BaRGS_00040443 [Batillaria attramentaria]|uniref:Kringle domain-containing protein n=1 Tax=Batillaria attramentaria TaxID=370345 RepID=A0ABD0J0A7_9CAEN
MLTVLSAEQSSTESTLGLGLADSAIDGNMTTCSQTLIGSTKFWKAVLGNTSQLYDVSRVEIFVSETMESSQYEMSVKLIGGTHMFCGVMQSPSSQHGAELACAKEKGLYPWGHSLRIDADFSKTGSLELCEVRIWGTPHGDVCQSPPVVAGLEVHRRLARKQLPLAVYGCANGFSPLLGENRVRYRKNYVTASWYQRARKRRATGTTTPLPSKAADGRDDTCSSFQWASDLRYDLNQTMEIDTVAIVVRKTDCAGNPTADVRVMTNDNVLRSCRQVAVNTTSFNYKLVSTCPQRPISSAVVFNLSCDGAISGLICELRIFGHPVEQAPLECLGSDGGVDYKGRTSVTINGRVCQRWDQLDPGGAEYFPYSAESFPDSSLSDAENFCRNPSGDATVWCYVQVTGKSGTTSLKREYCDVPTCGNLTALTPPEETTTQSDLTTATTIDVTTRVDTTASLTSQTPDVTSATSDLDLTTMTETLTRTADNVTFDDTAGTYSDSTPKENENIGTTTVGSNGSLATNPATLDTTAADTDHAGTTQNADTRMTVTVKDDDGTTAPTEELTERADKTTVNANDATGNKNVAPTSTPTTTPTTAPKTQTTPVAETNVTGSANKTEAVNSACACRQQLPGPRNVSEAISAMREKLAVSKGNLSRTRRMKTSVEDDRLSAICVGAMGIVGLTGFLAVFVASDVISAFVFLSDFLCKRNKSYSGAKK